MTAVEACGTLKKQAHSKKSMLTNLGPLINQSSPMQEYVEPARLIFHQQIGPNRV